MDNCEETENTDNYNNWNGFAINKWNHIWYTDVILVLNESSIWIKAKS